MPRTIRVFHGPNLNMLGTREPHLYGTTTLAQINAALTERAAAAGVTLTATQSNHEGVLLDAIQAATGLAGGDDAAADGVIINAGAFTHTSIAIHDALAMLACPVIEIHISNVYLREPFRHHSYLSSVATGVIAGLGWRGYLAALDYLLARFEETGR